MQSLTAGQSRLLVHAAVSGFLRGAQAGNEQGQQGDAQCQSREGSCHEGLRCMRRGMPEYLGLLKAVSKPQIIAHKAAARRTVACP